MRNPLGALVGLVGLAALSASILRASPPKPVPMAPATKAEWREDMAYFARRLPKRHANAFHAVTRERFAEAVAALDAGADAATDDQLFVGLMRLTALIGDGHTGVHLPSNFHQFPIAIVRMKGPIGSCAPRDRALRSSEER